MDPNKTEMKKEMLSKYQLINVDFYKIPIDKLKNWYQKLFWWRKISASLWKLATLFKVRTKTKKIHPVK